MNPRGLLANLAVALRRAVQEAYAEAAPQSLGFALRLLQNDIALLSDEEVADYLPNVIASSPYGGVPTVALLGYILGRTRGGASSDVAREAFRRAVERLRSRTGEEQEEIAHDDIALLGVADGLASLGHSNDEKDARRWIVDLVDRGGAPDGWSGRLRALAAELLEPRGRLEPKIDSNNWEAIALDLCLRERWPQAYREASFASRATQRALMQNLLLQPIPGSGELERVAVYLKTLELLAREAAIVLVPSVSDAVGFLRNTQAAMKRWVWDERSRKNTEVARWLIDNEYHVQSFLWAALYPIFGDHLVDETFLPGYGLLQPRADLGITSLKLIVEVKILRDPSDFVRVEEEIAGDLGTYFSAPERFDRLIAYVYDDCDVAHPERYDILRGALRQRDSRLEDVVVVRRPSMIPDRKYRNSPSKTLV